MSSSKSLLRIVTTGSVDDGKSTLMGRLLYETRSIFEDQFESIQKTSMKRGQEEVDLSLLLDGLAAEREQAITIDVAYRYFETEKRKFILADCPGHVQYTRNMVTGASTADCAVVLIDARNGMLTQSKRHAFILSLLQIRHVIVVVNKMDMVDYAQDVFERIVLAYREFAERLDMPNLAFLPVSALRGDNVTRLSPKMPWYTGPTLLELLESIHIQPDHNLVDFRFPVQSVIRPDQGFRGFAGRIASGTIRPGEEVAVLPSGRTSIVKSIVTYDGPLSEAFAPQSVVLTLADEIDVSRGCMIVRRKNLPMVGRRIEAILCWMADEPMRPGRAYLLKHTSNTVKAFVSELVYRFDVETLHRQQAGSLDMNEIGRVELETTQPIHFDPYKLNRSTGSFILVDPVSNMTAAAGMIRGMTSELDEVTRLERKPTGGISPNTMPAPANIPREAREERNGHAAVVLWFTGLSGSGKSTLGRALERLLYERGCQVVMLDGDQLRQGLCGDLGFSAADRTENIRRAGEAARLFFDTGHIVICSFISPIAKDRDAVRRLFPAGRFVEIHVACPLEICMERDPNRLYQKAVRGDIREFTGIESAYEPPQAPEVRLNSAEEGIEACLSAVMQHLSREKLV